MRILIFSDIHGNQYAFEKFYYQLEKADYDKIVFCGDIFGYYYGQRIIYDGLKKINNLIWLKGNHDQYFVNAYKDHSLIPGLVKKYGHSYSINMDLFSDEEIAYINHLSSSYILHDGNKRIGIFHGTPDNTLEGRLYPKDEPNKSFMNYDYVIIGHTHCRIVKNLGDTNIINSGSIGQPRDGNGYGYCMIDTDNGEINYYNIYPDVKALYRDIDQYDSELNKLKKVLERKKEDFK